jgi:hypothetical protein
MYIGKKKNPKRHFFPHQQKLNANPCIKSWKKWPFGIFAKFCTRYASVAYKMANTPERKGRAKGSHNVLIAKITAPPFLFCFHDPVGSSLARTRPTQTQRGTQKRTFHRGNYPHFEGVGA